jgi:hypothetical protein
MYCEGQEVQVYEGIKDLRSSALSQKQVGTCVTHFHPEGWGGTAPISSLLLLDDDHASTRRHASIWAPSRSQQMFTYFWDRD